MTAPAVVQVFDDSGAASRAAAESFRSRAGAAAEAGRRFSVALTGGSSPKELFSLLASDEYRDRIDWRAVHLFWGDERCVPPGHPRSNFGMAHRLLLSHVPIPAGNLHRIRGELSPDRGAELYAQQVERFFGGEPRFDLVHLGMGDDGHVCSLFPFDPLLRERRRNAGVALKLPEGEWRVSLTYPVLNAARRIEFLVFAGAKADRVREVVVGARDPLRIPAQGVRPHSGEVVWWLDRAAAAALGKTDG